MAIAMLQAGNAKAGFLLLFEAEAAPWLPLSVGDEAEATAEPAFTSVSTTALLLAAVVVGLELPELAPEATKPKTCLAFDAAEPLEFDEF